MLQSNSLPAVATLALAWVGWRVLRIFLYPHPLDRVPGLKASSWIAGGLTQVFDRNGWNFHDDMAEKHGGVFRFQGFFGARSLYVHDPKALHHIVLKDQHLYEHSDDMLLVNNLVFGPGLLSTLGSHHRKQRKMLNPIFSLSQMRDMTPSSYEVGQEMCDSIAREVSKNPESVDMLDWLTRTALEFVAKGVMGTTFEALKPGSADHPYWLSMKNFARIMTLPEFMFPRFFILPYSGEIGTSRFRRWVIDTLPWKNLHILRDMVDVMHRTSISIFESRKQAVQKGEDPAAQAGRGKDILSVVLKANLSASEEDRLPESELLAQLSTITFAGMDTTSNALARVLYLLCENPEAQERLRQEITEAQPAHGELQYDDLIALPYLDAVCKETLRVYTPIPMIVKQSQEDAVLPLSKPLATTDGDVVTEIYVPKNTYIVLSLSSCNRDPGIWGEDAREWKPERWLTTLPETVFNARIPGVWSHLMTFYGGMRACIGFKFAELEMKIVLSTLLRRFRFTFSDKKILWMMNGVNQPMSESADSELDDFGLPRLQLPLHVSLLSES